jgi:N-acyl homoserine lactone hydrolase
MSGSVAMATERLNLFMRGTTDRMLEAKAPLREWPFPRPVDAETPALLDVFGNGSLWALHVPGHTRGGGEGTSGSWLAA